MGIGQELDKTKDSLRLARKSVLARGGEISLTAGLKDLPSAVYKIPAGSSLAYQKDDSIAYQKIVPVGAEEYARINKVGGMTHRIEPEYEIVSTDSSDEDGFVTVYYDTRLTISLLDYSKPHYFALAAECPEIEHIEVTLVFVTIDEETGGYNVDERCYPLNSWVPSYNYEDYHAVDTKIDVWLKPGVEKATFMPIFADTDDLTVKLLDTAVTELVSESANLLEYPTEYVSSQAIGLTFTDNGDGTYTASGTATSDQTTSYLQLRVYKTLPAGTYTFYGVSGGSSTTYKVRYNTSKNNIDVKDGWYTYTFDTDVTLNVINLSVLKGVTVNNLVFSPMIVKGANTNVPYKPYRADAVDTFAISAELRTFLEEYDYGRGVNGAPNEIDFNNKKFYQRVLKGRIPSSSKWTLSNGIFQIALKHIGLPNFNTIYWSRSLSNEYLCTNNHASTNKVFWTNSAGVWLNIKDTRFNSVEEFNTYLGENIVSMVYPIAEPNEVDISQYLDNDNFIAVEGAGALTFKNEHEQAAPSTIEYIFKTEGE